MLIGVITKLAATSASENWIFFFDMAILKTIFDTRKILNDKPFLSFFLNPANHIEFFSVILKSDMDPGCILLNINPIPIGEISTKAFSV